MKEDRWSRRSFLQIGGIAGTLFFAGESMYAEDKKLIPAVEAVDHLLLAIADLDRGIEWAEKTLGVKAMAGGSHPGRGTRNALLSLGDKRYLEIIAFDPDQKTSNFPIDIRNIIEPQLIMWAAGTNDIDGLAKSAIASNVKVIGPFPGSRERPDGKTLKWKTLPIPHQLSQNNVDPIPFFIEWSTDSIHPSQDSPKGCTLESFTIEHPEADKVRETLKALGLDVTVNQSENAKLIASLKTPNGQLKLS